MSFFIEPAYAEAAASSPEAGFITFLPMIILFGLLWFLLIRPQQKRAKEHRNMVGALKEGDEVVTNGGLLGRITRVGENFVTLVVAEGIAFNVQRHAVATQMPKGTMKAETGGTKGGKDKGKENKGNKEENNGKGEG